MKKLPPPVIITVTLILINAVFWFTYTIITIYGESSFNFIPGILKWVFLILAVGSSLILAGIGYFLTRRNRIAFYLGILFLTMIAVLSITDDFG
jgi:hypothetical protein